MPSRRGDLNGPIDTVLWKLALAHGEWDVVRELSGHQNNLRGISEAIPNWGQRKKEAVSGLFQTKYGNTPNHW